MQDVRPRRNFLKLPWPFFRSHFHPNARTRAEIFGITPHGQGSSSPTAPVADLFPTQPPELAREMVAVSHYDLNRVKELVEARPSLSRAAWDWGFGDWERR